MPNWRAREERRAKAAEEYERQHRAEEEAAAGRFLDYRAGRLPPEAPLAEAVAWLLQRVAALEEQLAKARGASPAQGQREIEG